MRRNDRDPSASSGPSAASVARSPSPRRRLTLSVTFLSVLVGLLSMTNTVGAKSAPIVPAQDSLDPSVFDVFQMSGLLDDVVADYLERLIDETERAGSGGLVLQVNSTEAVIGDARLDALARRIHNAEIPIYAWVGPSGAAAYGRVAQLLAVTDEIAVSVGSSFGNIGDLAIDEELLSENFLAVAETLRDRTVDEESVREFGLTDRDSPTIAFFVLDLPGFESEIDNSGDEAVRVPVSGIRFWKLPLFDGWMHAFASPSMAYLLFLFGAGLAIFELYTAGVGIAGVLGAGCFILGCFGLDVLPTRPWAVALLVIAMLGYAIDVQTGVSQAWSAIATICLIVGSLFLFDGMGISIIALLTGIVGVSLSMISGMPAMIRTRFGTPTIGREWMVGSMGEAAEDIKKEGVVFVDGAPWRARVNRTTPIAKGDPVRVVAIEGLYLEIEPEEGGARDYREHRKSDGESDLPLDT